LSLYLDLLIYTYTPPIVISPIIATARNPLLLTDEGVSVGIVIRVGEVAGDRVGAIVGNAVLVAKTAKVTVGVTVIIPFVDIAS
jgi:hypothetical protein